MPRRTSWAPCAGPPTGRRRMTPIGPAGCGAPTPRRQGEGGRHMSTIPPAEVVTTLPAVPSGGGLVAAIAAVMNEVHVVAKRGENEFHRYRYATMGDILKEVTPLLGRFGIVIFQSETGRAMFDDDNVIAIEYAFTVAHASGETWPHVIKQTGVSTFRNSKDS